MLDLIGAMSIAAAYLLVIGVLLSHSQASNAHKWTAAAAAAVWGVGITAIAASGGFAPGATGPIPGPVLAFAAAIALLFGSWLLAPQFRAAILSVPLRVLIALNIVRVGGILFLMLAASGRLSAPFAPSAGWGDILTGVLAIPLAMMLRQGPHYPTVALWNAFGSLDLIAAIALGALSAPGAPIQVFTDEPGTLAMTELPWTIVPTTLVPIYLFMHFVIAKQIRQSFRIPKVEATAG